MPVPLTAQPQVAAPTPFDLTVRHSLSCSRRLVGELHFDRIYRPTLDDLDTGPPDRHMLQVLQQSLISTLAIVETGRDLGEHLTVSRLEDTLADIRDRLRHGGIKA
ncbi:hypothetical protein D3875_03900 [Deinococcus cavernae]|uniref:Uncharacterized protein n=1 Tax=Deinococcus cavernae TaxID=2320857 RepID=A0A418VEB0_9DEIO|nr:hypothetical protein [Deinococcus cavernae]RJF74429.1 hypothetical protein D3875_03900 [Deinococcus cavernae]